ncbi:MAG: hypothetical protein L7U87_03645 [Chlamydiales bacterium]|nr:hypothetical protein [Chlamydiales bacterium]
MQIPSASESSKLSKALIDELHEQGIKQTGKEKWVNKEKLEKHGDLIRTWLKAKQLLNKSEGDKS